MNGNSKSMIAASVFQRIADELAETFTRLDTFFDLPADLRQFHPAPNEWCINEILEHITLTSHFLLITLSQSLKKVLRRVQDQPIPDTESDLDKIQLISNPDAFSWIRPEHMEPTRTVSNETVRHRMKQQQVECEVILAQIPNGEGKLHRVRMSVRELGRLDMYEWLYFLIQHARRHLVEMERICDQYQAC